MNLMHIACGLHQHVVIVMTGRHLPAGSKPCALDPSHFTPADPTLCICTLGICTLGILPQLALLCAFVAVQLAAHTLVIKRLKGPRTAPTL